jgi:hypothetical protein
LRWQSWPSTETGSIRLSVMSRILLIHSRHPMERSDLSWNEEWREDWLDYSKSRYESARSGIIEFRAWARQLFAAMAVVIGLEVNLLLKVQDVGDGWCRHAAVGWLVITIIYQLLIAGRLVRLGYQMQWAQEVPRNPRSMKHALRMGGGKEAVGDQYAHAYTDRRAISRKVAAELASESKGFVRSLMVGLLVAVFLSIGASFKSQEVLPGTGAAKPDGVHSR